MLNPTDNSMQIACRPASALLASALVLGCLALLPAAQTNADEADSRDLTMEQSAVFNLHPPAPVTSFQNPLSVVAWVDHADNTYAIGETVRLFVKANKDAYLTVMNVGPSGNTTLLFPNALQTNARVRANQIVEIPPPGSGASIRVSGPVGRELIKVIASTSPAPIVKPQGTSGSGPFAPLETGRSLARDLQVTMSAQPTYEWDDYNKVITTIASRPFAAVPLVPAPAASVTWPTMGSGLRIATDKAHYRIGESVSIYASTTTPCHLTLINIGSSGQARVLLPNAAQPQNLIPAGHTVVFPTAASGLHVTPIGPPGVETVTAICSTDNQPMFPGYLSYDQSGFAMLGAGLSTRDLVVVATTPTRQVAHATVGFLVTH